MFDILSDIPRWEYACALLYARKGITEEVTGEDSYPYFYEAAKLELDHANRWRSLLDTWQYKEDNFWIEARDGIQELRGDDFLPQDWNECDGISDRYAWARWFFKGRARDLPTADLLAAAVSGEVVVAIAYFVFSLFTSKKYSDEAKAIAKEEFFHKGDIFKALVKVAGLKKATLLVPYWAVRLIIACFWIGGQFGVQQLIYRKTR